MATTVEEARARKPERIAFLDWLRCAACFMVMAVHATEGFYLGGDAPDVTFVASRSDMFWVTLSECLCRACVPLFAIASSYLLFPVRGETGPFLKRRLMRVGVPFAVWAAAYVAWYGDAPGCWGRLLFNFPDEAGHLWFVPMLAGLYLLMPLLSPWARGVSKRELNGWIILWLATTLMPFARAAWGRLWGAPSFGALPYLWGEAPWNHFGAFHYVSGFIGYLLIGLWFRRFAPPLDWRRTLCAAIPLWLAGAATMGIPFYRFAGAFPYRAPYQAAVVMETSIEYCSLGVALATIAAFLVFRKIEFRGKFYERIVRPVAEASFGMYLMHMFLLPTILGFLRQRIPTPAAIFATAAATFAATAVASATIRRIPFVGKQVCG